MWVCTYFVWFVIYSVFGWIYESTYCTINERKWENRGFLYGPVCPIYGTGIVAMMALWSALQADNVPVTWWQVFLVAFVGSAILEYTTHWALEKLFHAYWWDYSNMPLNLNGRICLPASILFGLGGLLVVYVLYQPTVNITAGIPAPVIAFLSLLLCALMAADTAITVSALQQFARAASSINQSVNTHMDRLVASAVERSQAAAAQLQERRDDAATAIAETAAAIKETGDSVSEQLQERGEMATAALARERDRFAAAMRDSLLGTSGHYVRSAARRVKGIANPARLTDQLPETEQLVSLWNDVREKHWPH